MKNPFGKYGPAAATIVGIGLVAAFIIGVLFQHLLNLSPDDLQSLRELALVGVASVLGQSVGFSGSSQEIAAVHRRLDEMGMPRSNNV